MMRQQVHTQMALLCVYIYSIELKRAEYVGTYEITRRSASGPLNNTEYTAEARRMGCFRCRHV